MPNGLKAGYDAFLVPALAEAIMRTSEFNYV